MVERKYMPYQASDRDYPKLAESLQSRLRDIPPSQSDDLKLWPCRAVLKNGEVLDNVYFAEARSYIKYWGVWPEDDPAKKSVDISEVTNIEPSPNRMPLQFSKMLYASGESGMGYLFFKILFSDGSEQSYVMGNAVDFIELPAGKVMSDIVDIKPHEGKNDKNILKGPDYLWCLFDES